MTTSLVMRRMDAEASQGARKRPLVLDGADRAPPVKAKPPDKGSSVLGGAPAGD